MSDNFLTLDEFGTDLYAAIRTNAARIQCEKNAVTFTKNGKTRKADEATRLAQSFAQELQVILSRGTLQPNDVRRLLAMGK